jgi:hypothetical protein
MSKEQSNRRFLLADAFLAACLVWAVEFGRSYLYPNEGVFSGGQAFLLWALLTLGLHVSGRIIIAFIEWLLTPQSDGTEVRPLNSPPFPIAIVPEVVEEPVAYDEFWDGWEEQP